MDKKKLTSTSKVFCKLDMGEGLGTARKERNLYQILDSLP